MKPWTNEAWMRDRLVKKRMSCDQVCKELNDMGYKVTKMTVYNWAIKLGIKTQTKSYGPRSVSSGQRRSYY